MLLIQTFSSRLKLPMATEMALSLYHGMMLLLPIHRESLSLPPSSLSSSCSCTSCSCSCSFSSYSSASSLLCLLDRHHRRPSRCFCCNSVAAYSIHRRRLLFKPLIFDFPFLSLYWEDVLGRGKNKFVVAYRGCMIYQLKAYVLSFVFMPFSDRANPCNFLQTWVNSDMQMRLKYWFVRVGQRTRYSQNLSVFGYFPFVSAQWCQLWPSIEL